jgi:hypothetical protein
MITITSSAPRRRWPVPGVAADAPPALPWSARFPLHAAACCADAAELRALVLAARGGATAGGLDELDEEGRAALHYAAWNGLDAPVAMLLAAGAAPDVRSRDRGATPLHFAAGMAHPAALRLLLRGGADPRALDADKWTPLDLARQDLAGVGRCARADEVLALLEASLQGGAAPRPAADANADAAAAAATQPAAAAAAASAPPAGHEADASRNAERAAAE